MFGTIEVPKNFYDYDKRDEAMMTTRQASKPAVKKAAVGAEEKALEQAAVQQANAEKDVVKSVTATAKKAEKSAAMEHQFEPAEEKTAGDKATKQEAAAQVQHGCGHSARPAESLGRLGPSPGTRPCIPANLKA